MKNGDVLVMKAKGRKLIKESYPLYCCPMYRKGMFLDNNMDHKYMAGLFHWCMIKTDEGIQN